MINTKRARLRRRDREGCSNRGAVNVQPGSGQWLFHARAYVHGTIKRHSLYSAAERYDDRMIGSSRRIIIGVCTGGGGRQPMLPPEFSLPPRFASNFRMAKMQLT